MIGGGILALPFVFLQLGIIASFAFLIAMCFITLNSSMLYLQIRDMLPGKPDSLFEIGYLIQKRSSVFILGILINLYTLGATTLYFKVFSDIMANLCLLIIGKTKNSFLIMLLSPLFWVGFVACINIPIIIKKEIQELHVLSITLFAFIIVFIIILFV